MKQGWPWRVTSCISWSCPIAVSPQVGISTKSAAKVRVPCSQLWVNYLLMLRLSFRLVMLVPALACVYCQNSLAGNICFWTFEVESKWSSIAWPIVCTTNCRCRLDPPITHKWDRVRGEFLGHWTQSPQFFNHNRCGECSAKGKNQISGWTVFVLWHWSRYLYYAYYQRLVAWAPSSARWWCQLRLRFWIWTLWSSHLVRPSRYIRTQPTCFLD